MDDPEITSELAEITDGQNELNDDNAYSGITRPWRPQDADKEVIREAIRRRVRTSSVADNAIFYPAKPKPTINDTDDKRVAVYARVSTKSTEQVSSIENQTKYYTEKIQKTPNWTLQEIYSDEGKSGTSTKKRAAFNRMMKDARNKEMDTRKALYMENKDQELTAVLMDRYLLPFGRHVNPSVPTEKLKQTIEEMELTLKELAPSEKNDEVKKIWLILPRGSISDYESYEELIECEEVHNYDEYIQRWEQEYPDQPTWYELTFVKTDTYCGLFINNKHIVSLVLDKGTVDINYTLEAAESFFPLLVGAAAKSMEILKKGEYNAFVEKNLPYYYRTGVIKRSDEWKGDPGAKERIFEGLSEETYKEFRQYIENGENYQNQIGRLKEMTGNDFLRACSVGYKACGYKGTDLPLVDQYMMHADGRDDGLTGKGHTLNRSKGIDLDDPKAWDEWIANKDRNIGHPWEVCRGGNSTHISLFVWHDSFEIDHFERTGRLTHEEAEEARKNSGYYFELEGTAWTRACETVNFFVALRKAGYPVLLLDADPILSRFKGEDLIGIVPRPVTPAYCESMFPASLGRILDFMNVYDEDMELFGDSIEWLPITPAKLL